MDERKRAEASVCHILANVFNVSIAIAQLETYKRERKQTSQSCEMKNFIMHYMDISFPFPLSVSSG